MSVSSSKNQAFPAPSTELQKHQDPKNQESESCLPPMTNWRAIRDFPGYSVSDLGSVRNDETKYLLSPCVNQYGAVHVGLTLDRIQYRRSVPLLVAEAFLPEPPHVSFETAINLNGDRLDNRVNNLMWRPRWFAMQYTRQFVDHDPEFEIPVVELIRDGKRTIRKKFSSSWDAATEYGLIDRQIKLAARAGVPVWPTRQMFRLI